MVKVEIVYVAHDKSVAHLDCVLEQGAKVADALSKSGLLLDYPEIQNFSIGIFAKIVTLDTPLKNGDRIEIYRPLISDPKEKRKQRAKGSQK